MLPNAFGLHHVHGNVFEWCQDRFVRYGENAPDIGAGLRSSAKGSARVIPSGSFDKSFWQARSAYRRSESPQAPGGNIGLRSAGPRQTRSPLLC
ncbi:MAG: hypothetical protein CSA62_01465 [Planctomycetota bacterium]|nr:MAG: hypothetical protein CSA62_01465 [Planctomycetota bacterium]